MRVKTRYGSLLMVTAGCLGGMISAPTASAQPNCETTSPGTTVCTTTGGSTSIHTAPRQTGPYLPYGCDPAYAALCYDNIPGITINLGGRRR